MMGCDCFGVGFGWGILMDFWVVLGDFFDVVFDGIWVDKILLLS